ncbi:MAG: TetR/AcrR family transcriptional regulator [Planctomycetaceae bacterium]|jgi:AcrR family transcriptional regulator|nr:TetR/AcrR family transcriptional regulator [Planctomycetaceae bacterium]
MLKKSKQSAKKILYSGTEFPVPDQKHAHKELTIKDRLICRAFHLFSERGFAQVSLDDVASEENVTKGCIYGYFASKQELVLATCHYFYQNWQENAFQEIALGKSPRDSLERLIRFSVNCCINDSRNRVFTTEICAMALRDPEIRNGWNQFASTTRDAFFAMASAAVKQGDMNISNVRLAVDWMYSTFQGVKLRAVYEPNFCDSERVERVVRFLMRQLESECFFNES